MKKNLETWRIADVGVDAIDKHRIKESSTWEQDFVFYNINLMPQKKDVDRIENISDMSWWEKMIIKVKMFQMDLAILFITIDKITRIITV